MARLDTASCPLSWGVRPDPCCTLMKATSQRSAAPEPAAPSCCSSACSVLHQSSSGFQVRQITDILFPLRLCTFAHPKSA